jgi:hypothetical protein
MPQDLKKRTRVPGFVACHMKRRRHACGTRVRGMSYEEEACMWYPGLFKVIQ